MSKLTSYNFIQKLCEISYIYAKESLQNRALRKTKKNPKFAYHLNTFVSARSESPNILSTFLLLL